MRSDHSFSKRARAGFTLIELLVVVAILGVVSAGAVLSTGDGNEEAFDAIEIRVDDALNRASTLARSQRIHYGVVFDVGRNRYGIVDETGALATHPLTKGNYVVELDAPGMPGGLEITGANFGDAGVAAIFDGQGVLLRGGSFTVTRNGVSRTFDVNAATANLTVAP